MTIYELFRIFALMLVKTEAIVLHSIKYGETRLIVDVFSRESGRISLITSMPKTQKGRLKKQYFQPMTLLEITYDQRQRVQLQQLKDARLLFPWTTIPFSPEKLALSLFVAEFLYHALRSEQQSVSLFHYVIDSLQWLDMAERGYANFHLTFLMRMSRFLGFFPNLENYTPGCIFDLRAGTFINNIPLHHDYLQPEESGLIHLLMRMDYSTMHVYRFSHHERNRIVEVLLHYYRLHIPQFPELKSLQVLRDLWA